MIILMGLPGAGKGTQGKIMADQHGMHLLSMGDIVRIYVTGERRARMLSGELLDDQEVIDLLDRLLDTVANKDLCVIDGFPRTIPQAEWLLNKSHKEGFRISHVINLEASESTVTNRLHARGRLDDQDKVIEERFKKYRELTLPLYDWFLSHDIDVINIDAERSVDEVNLEVTKRLDIFN